MAKKRRKKGPPRAEQHVIEEKAKRIYEGALPPEWLNRPQTPDYHIDYQAELVKDGNLSGLLVGVQLRGKKALRIARGHVAYSLPTDQLAYYLDKRRDPVFLVLVDVTTREGFYLFTQRYTLEQLAGNEWRKKKSITVHAPLANNLRDVKKLESDAREADKYMAGVRPAAIEASIRAERQKYESLDPRFSVAITATEMTRHYQLSAKEDVIFTLSFKGDPVKNRKMMEDLQRGLPVTAEPGEVEIVGSELLASPLQTDVPIQLHATRRVELVARIAAIDSAGREPTAFEVQARGEGGPLEMRLAAVLENAPFEMAIIVSPDSGTPRPSEWSLSFPLLNWVGRPLLFLPHFDRLRAFTKAVVSGCSLRVDLYWHGNRMMGGTAPAERIAALRDLATIVETLAKGREFARHYGLNPEIPPDFSEDDLNQIENAYWRGMPGERSMAGDDDGRSTLAGFTSPDAVERLIAEHDQFPLIVTIPDEPLMFMRRAVATGPVQYSLSHPKLVTPAAELRRKAAAGISRIPFTFKATPRSEIMVQRAAPSLAASALDDVT